MLVKAVYALEGRQSLSSYKNKFAGIFINYAQIVILVALA